MSEFEVNVVTILTVDKHPNADKLDVVTVANFGYTIITQRNTYKSGNMAFLFQPDSILPERLIEHFGLTYLHKGNRVKETKLRGIVSQAMILPYDELADAFDIRKYGLELNFAELLNVTKYEKPETFSLGQSRGSLPKGVEKYDIENAERKMHIFNILQNKTVYITEKLEGTNLCVFIDADDEIHVCSRTRDVADADGVTYFEKNVYWEAAREHGWIDAVKDIKKSYNVQTVALRGEIVGESIQGNIYDIKGLRAYLFDIQFDGAYLPVTMSYFLASNFNLIVVPMIYYGLFSDYANTVEDLKTVSNGNSRLHNVLREGVVITPMIECSSHLGERIQLKQRSPEYLAKSS